MVPGIGKSATIHTMMYEGEPLFSMDIEGDGNGVFVFGQKYLDKLIIIDESSYFDTKIVRKMMAYARGDKALKPAVKQPDWARYNQAPRSARKRR